MDDRQWYDRTGLDSRYAGRGAPATLYMVVSTACRITSDTRSWLLGGTSMGSTLVLEYEQQGSTIRDHHDTERFPPYTTFMT